MTFCNRMRTCSSLSDRVCSWLNPRAWSSSCWMICWKTQPWRLSDTTWPPPRRPTKEKHLKEIKEHTSRATLLLLTFDRLNLMRNLLMASKLLSINARQLFIPWARLNVHKISLSIQGREADTGGLCKWSQTLDDRRALSLGLSGKSCFCYQLLLKFCFITQKTQRLTKHIGNAVRYINVAISSFLPQAASSCTGISILQTCWHCYVSKHHKRVIQVLSFKI